MKPSFISVPGHDPFNLKGVAVDAYRVIIADRHRDFREAVRRVVHGQPGLDLTAEAREGLALLNVVRYCPPGPLLVILDVSLPNIPWMEAIRKVKKDHADTQVLVLSMHEDPEYLEQALSSGAEGYLMKDGIESEILQAIETIREGRVYISRALASSGPRQSPAQGDALLTDISKAEEVLS